MRLDALLVEKGLATGRDKAKGVIMAGQVYVDNQKADKPGMEVSANCAVEVRGARLAYVSRGGLKLEKAVEEFSLDLTQRICVDIGASTGGFTDCMLQNGAAKVYAIDVGYGQLAWKLRNNSKVVVLERTNIRHVTKEQVPEPVGFISIDVSFISLELVLPVAASLLEENGEIVCLVKPQFEAGKEKVGKKGVVKEPGIHKEVLVKVASFTKCRDLQICNISYSPVKGPEGNIEYLMYLRKTVPAHSSNDIQNWNAIIDKVVRESHESLQVK